jgi:GNAT superfamily N-acetyltransferase
MEFRRECGRCQVALPPEEAAYICAHECTFCPTCVRQLKFVCPNCSGELVRRPRRPAPNGPPSGVPSAPGRTLSVRRASAQDLDALVPLFDGYRRFYQQAPDLDGARTFLSDRLSRDEAVVLIAEDRGSAVGFTLLYPSFTSVSLGPIFVLNDLFVAPEARRTGVGARLLDAARKFGAERGAHYLELSTAVDNPAQRLYESHGWTLDREFLHYELPVPSVSRRS